MKAYHSQRLIEEREAVMRARELPLRPTPPAAAAPASGKGAAPKAGPLVGTPICVECAYHAVRFEWITGRILHSCHHPWTRDPVTGSPSNPADQRRVTGRCGPAAKHWQTKPAMPVRPREIEVASDTEPQQYFPPVPVRLLAAPPRDEILVVLWPQM